jgi:chromate transporter
MAEPAQDTSTPFPSQRSRLREVALLFLRLGFTAFGGPAAHVAMMEDEVVTRRKWLDRQHFLDLVAAVNFVPGPNSTELAIHLGLIRAGRAGLVVAGVCFIGPAVIIILPLAWMYCAYGTGPHARRAWRG